MSTHAAIGIRLNDGSGCALQSFSGKWMRIKVEIDMQHPIGIYPVKKAK